MELQTEKSERRRHPRTISHTTALIVTDRMRVECEVSNLSVSGALVVGGPSYKIGSIVRVVLHLPLYPDIRVAARVVRCEPTQSAHEIGLAFLHETDITEDHIQSALLSEIERSQTHGVIPADLR